MAELDPQMPAETIVEEIVVTEETTTVIIPPNRPRKVSAGMFGPLEIAAVAIGVMMLLASVFLYFFFVIPSNRELARNKSEADRLEAEVESANKKYGEMTDTEAHVAKLVNSVDDFETRFLPIQSYGQAALYQRLNGLIAAYDLQNTTGPDYAPLDSNVNDNPNQEKEEEKGRAKFRSLYPGVYVTVTVEGSYQNLRRFIREIETGRDFVVISAVELAPSDTEATKQGENTAAAPAQQNINPGAVAPNGKGFARPPAGINQVAGQQPAQQLAKPKGKTRGEVVALHIEMATYFRRPGFVPGSMAPAEQY